LTAYHGESGGHDVLQQLLDAAHAVKGCEPVTAALKALRSRWLLV